MGEVESVEHVGGSARARTDSEAMRRRVASSGVPRMRMIWLSWSLLSRPRKSGTPEIILRAESRQRRCKESV